MAPPLWCAHATKPNATPQPQMQGLRMPVGVIAAGAEAVGSAGFLQWRVVVISTS